MKKFLLLAVAALMAVSVSAQPLSSAKKQMKSQPAIGTSPVKVSDDLVLKASSKFKATPQPKVRQGVKNPSLAQKSIKNFTPANRFKATTVRKAAALKGFYTGVCVDNDADNQVWKMTPTVVTDEVGGEFPGLIDLVPNAFAEIGLEYTFVAYEDNDGELLVPAQPIGTLSFSDGSSYEVFITNFSASSEDGSMTLTYDGEGQLTCGAPYIAYVLLPAGAEEFSFDAMVTWWSYYQNIKYIAEGDEAAPEPAFAAESAVLYSAISFDGHQFMYQHVMMPGDAPVLFKNYTMDPADTWQWKTATLEWEDLLEMYIDKDVVMADTKDFTLTPLAGELYGPVELTAALGDKESEPVLGMESDALLYAGANGGDWYFANEAGEREAPIITRSNIANDLTGISYVGSEEGVRSMILYQGKPSAPLYFEGVNLLVYGFEKLADEVELKCKIQKIQRAKNGSITLGDVIAEADLDQEDILAGSWNGTAQLNWNEFYVVDELGMSETLDYIQTEDEFAIVFEGLDNDTFSGLLIGDNGPANGLTSSYVVLSDEEEYGGIAYWGYYGNVLAGLKNAIYGYLHTEDETDLHFAKEGGEASIHVQPMFYNGGDADQQTALWLQEGSEIPEWLEVGIANEVYTSDDFGFDLVVKADALDGEDSREAELVFEQWGAKLVVNVAQGEQAPVITINVEREVGLGYGVTSYEPDFTEALAYLGIANETEATVVGINADGSEEAAPGPGGIDGWCDADGNFIGWGQDDTRICVKFFPSVPQYEICDMNGADVVGAEYTVKYGLKANEKTAIFAITVKFVEKEVKIYKPEIVKTIEISHLEKAAAAYNEEEPAPKFDVAEVCEALGIASIGEAKTYIVNLTDGNFVENTTDGWRNADGDAAMWAECANGFCLKLDNPASGEFNYTGAHDANFQVGDTYVAQWGVVANEKAVLLKVTVTFVDDPISGITELNADKQAGAIYNLNGVRVQNAQQKGVYIQNGKKVVIK